MIIRTPPSLNWLVKKYKRLTYQRDFVTCEIESEYENLIKLEGNLSDLNKQIKALEEVIDLHEIPITSSDIPYQKFYRNVTQLQYGEVTRQIYKCLKRGGVYASTEIVEFIIGELSLMFEDNSSRREFAIAVGHRLRNLLKDEKITRVTKGTGFKSPTWKLKIE